MALDNSNETASDTIRTIDRLSGGIKTPVIQLDFGGDNSSAESLHTKTNALPSRLIDDAPSSITITANDAVVSAPFTTGTPVSGTPTAGSTAAFLLAGGDGTVLLYLSGNGGLANFEYSTDTTDAVNGNWVSVYGVQDGVGEPTWVSAAIGPGLFSIPVSGARGFRVRNCITFTTSYSVTARFSQNPTLGRVHLVANGKVALSGSVAFDQTSPGVSNGVIDQASDDTVVSSTAQTTLNNNLALAVPGSGSFDAINLRSVSMYIVPAAGTVTAGAVTFEESDDNSNWIALLVYDENAQTVAPVSSYTIVAATGRMFSAPLRHRYFRARISTGLTGTSAGLTSSIYFRGQPYTPPGGTLAPGSVNAIQSGTWNVATVTTVTAVTTLSNGQTAHSSASTGSPVRVGGRVNTAVDTTLVAGDASDVFMTTGGAAVIKPYAVPEVDWQASSGLTPLATTTSTAIKAAGAAGVRNYCTAIQIQNTSGSVAPTVAILDGASVLWAGNLPISMAVPLVIQFPTPLRGTAATALNIQLGSTAASVFWNAQGYQAP